MPSGPGCIDEETIADIANHVRGRVETFLLTCKTDPAAIANQWMRCGTTTLQLVDHETAKPEKIQQLRELTNGARLIQVIHVEDESSIRLANEVSGLVDGLLLDSGRPNAPVRELGGTGKVHDWRLSRRIVEENPGVDIWLAGGLNPSNVGDVMEKVSPTGLDVCSGLRTSGRLDEEKLSRFMAIVRSKGR